MPRYSTQFPAASKILSKYEHDRAFRLHREKVTNVKPGLDNKPPKRYPHLMVRMKQVQKEEERLSEVDHENKLLLQKMMYIMKTRGRIDNWNLDFEPGSLHSSYKQRQLEKIAAENVGIAKRLEHTKPVYNSLNLEGDYQRNKYYQTLREESTKDYEETPRRSKKWKSVDFEEEKKYDDDFESDDDKDKSETESPRLPQINEKKKSQSTKSKSESNVQKLPPIKEKDKKKGNAETEHNYDMYDPSRKYKTEAEGPGEADAKQLFKVAKQMAQPDDIIIRTLVKKSHAQRMQTKAKFHQLYDLDLDTELKDGLGSDWHLLVDALLSEQGTSECDALHKAVHSSNVPGIIEILCSGSTSSLATLKDAYRKEYAVSLENDLAEKIKNPVQCLLITLQKEGRDDSTIVDNKTAEKDAKALFESGDGRWEDESGQFIMLVSKRNIAQVKATIRMYKTVSGGMDAMQAVREECSSDYIEAINAFLHSAKNPQNVYAEKLYKNLDASNPAFVNTLVERSEIDMPAVRKAYRKKYDADLVDDMKDRCVHPTTKVLTELVYKSPPAANSKGKGENGRDKKNAGATPRKPPPRRPDNNKGSDNKNNPLSQTHQKRNDRQKDGKDKGKEKGKGGGGGGGGKGTVKPAKNFDVNADVEKLHEAMSGMGTDEAAIMEVITSKNNQQRQQLRTKYQEKYKKDLLSELKSELTGDYEEIVLALMMTPVEYDAHCLHEAVDGLGTNETVLIELLSTRSNKEIKDIKEKYKKDYNTDLEADLKGDTSGGFAEMLLYLAKGSKVTGSDVNAKEAEEDAKKMCKYGDKSVTLNTEVFRDVVLKKNPAQMKKTFEEYKKIAKQDIYESVRDIMSGDSEEGYLGLVKATEDSILFFVESLKESFAGMGTNEKRLIRIVVSRSEVDLGEIKAKYKEVTGKTLSESVNDECSGDLKKTLLSLIGDNDDESKEDISKKGGISTDTNQDPDSSKESQTNKENSNKATKKNIDSQDKNESKTSKEESHKKDTQKDSDKQKESQTNKEENSNKTTKKHIDSEGKNESKISRDNKDSHKDSDKQKENTTNKEELSNKATKKNIDSEGKNESKTSKDNKDSHKNSDKQKENKINKVEHSNKATKKFFDSEGKNERKSSKQESDKKQKDSQKDLDKQKENSTSRNKRSDKSEERMKQIYSKDVKSRKDSNSKKTKNEVSTSSDKDRDQDDDDEEEEKKDIHGHATITANKNFLPYKLCKKLHDAMDGLGTNESAIIQVLTSCNNKQRQRLKKTYEEKYKVNLVDELKGELSGDLETAVLGLMMEPVDFSAKCLYESMYGLGTDERLLTYVIVSSSPAEMKILNKRYKEAYKKDLSNDVRVETSGVLQKILLSMIADSDRKQSSDSPIDDDDVEQDAMKLYNNGQVAFKYDVDQSADILTTASRNKARRICERYGEMSGEDVLESIAKNTAGDSEIALLALGNYIVRMLRNPIKYISSALHDAVSGVGTSDTLLTYVIISRSEVDLVDVMKRYEEQYKKPLAKTIKSECSGDFRNILLAVLKPNTKTK